MPSRRGRTGGGLDAGVGGVRYTCCALGSADTGCGDRGGEGVDLALSQVKQGKGRGVSKATTVGSRRASPGGGGLGRRV